MRARGIVFLLIIFFIVAGCSKREDPYLPVGKPFVNTKVYSNLDLDKNARRLISTKTPILIKGQVTYYDDILGSWAFILPEDDDFANSAELLLVDFFTVSNNLTFPVKKIAEDILVEGILQKDETVLRGYILVPSGYQFVSENETVK